MGQLQQFHYSNALENIFLKKDGMNNITMEVGVFLFIKLT